MGAEVSRWNSVEQVSGECSLFHAGPPGMGDGGGMERLEQVGTVFAGVFSVPSSGAGAQEVGRTGARHHWRCMQDTSRAVEAYSPIMDGGWR